MMETIINDGICRCCATEGSFKDLDTAYHWMGSEEVYADMLRDCFDISLSKPETYNNGGICEVCITQLRNASNFKKQVQLTEKQFLKKVEESTFRANIVKIEVPRLEVDNDDIFDGNVSDGFSSPEYDVPLTKIKIEKESEKPKKRSTKASTSKAKKLKGEDGEPSSKRSRVIVIKVENKGEEEIEKKSSIITVQSMFKIQRSYSKEMYKHRHNIKEILGSTNATPIRCQTGLAYLCSFCEEQYINPADLKKHTLESHAGLDETHFLKRHDLARYVVKIDITDLYCTLCYENFDSLEKIVDHLKNIHKKTIYTDIGNQIVPFKFGPVNLRCCICLTEFSKFKMLLEHMHVHYRNYICEICNAGYVNRRNLQIHSQTHKVGTFNCSYCSKVFTTLSNKNSHERSVHGHNLKKLLNKCPFCSERFNGGRKRDRHVAQVHGFRQQAIQCHACDKSFLTQDALTTHKKRDHLMQRKFKCSQCDKSFFSGNELKNHMVKHTGVKEFVCEVCLKAYGRRKTLIEHLRIHADDRRFKCEHCGQAFVQKCSWRGHMRAKHGEDI